LAQALKFPFGIGQRLLRNPLHLRSALPQGALQNDAPFFFAPFSSSLSMRLAHADEGNEGDCGDTLEHC